MQTFTFEEMNLLCIYNTGTRAGLIAELQEMRGYLGKDETELLALTDSALQKLQGISDTDFTSLDLVPDFGGDDD